MQHTPESAAAAVAQKITANEATPEKVVCVPKGEGVWLATVKIAGDPRERHGVFLDTDLPAPA